MSPARLGTGVAGGSPALDPPARVVAIPRAATSRADVKPKLQETDMTDSSIPFFARFLEGQDYPELESDVRAGPGGGNGGGGGGGGTTRPDLDQVHTMKYPSDGDDDPPTI